jgi:predicted nucleic acid-binding protein
VLAVGTNVLVYAADADSQFHAACRDWLSGLIFCKGCGAIRVRHAVTLVDRANAPLTHNVNLNVLARPDSRELLPRK